MEDDRTEPGPSPEPVEPESGSTEADAPKLEKPSPEAADRAARLVTQYHVHARRGESTIARKLLDEALEIAPGSAEVLEAVALDFIERKQKMKAREVLKQGLELYPGHLQLERLYGELVFETASALSGPLYSQSEVMARSKMAGCLSVILPGLGQMVMGEIGLGIGFLVFWLGGWLGVAMVPGGLSNFAHLTGKASDFNGMVMLPLCVALLAHIASIADAGSRSKRFTKKQKVEHPKPPVDMEF